MIGKNGIHSIPEPALSLPVAEGPVLAWAAATQMAQQATQTALLQNNWKHKLPWNSVFQAVVLNKKGTSLLSILLMKQVLLVLVVVLRALLL